MKKLIIALLFCMMLVTINTSIVNNVYIDLVEGEIYPEPNIKMD